MGKESIWQVWRADLPVDPKLEQAAIARMRIWASYRDRDFARSRDVADLAMQLFDGLERERIIAPAGVTDVRSALYAAAIMHNVGLGVSGKKHGKSSYKRIRKTEAPLGFSAETYELAALAARYPRGAVTRPEARPLARLPEERKQAVQLGRGDPMPRGCFRLSRRQQDSASRSQPDDRCHRDLRRGLPRGRSPGPQAGDRQVPFGGRVPGSRADPAAQ